MLEPWATTLQVNFSKIGRFKKGSTYQLINKVVAAILGESLSGMIYLHSCATANRYKAVVMGPGALWGENSTTWLQHSLFIHEDNACAHTAKL